MTESERASGQENGAVLVCSPTQATHREKQLRHTRIRLYTRAVAYSEYPEAKQLDARVPVDTNEKCALTS